MRKLPPSFVPQFLEALETRRLLAVSAPFLHSPAPIWSQVMQDLEMGPGVKANGAVPAATNPSVTGMNPANGQADVPRYTPITLSIALVTPGRGIDPSTLNTDNV